VGNDFKGCHQGAKGGMFHLAKGAKVIITGRANTAAGNSALYGGFAYLHGLGTEMKVVPDEELPTSPANNWHSRPRSQYPQGHPLASCGLDKAEDMFAML
jgi:hypothetical protein